LEQAVLNISFSFAVVQVIKKKKWIRKIKLTRSIINPCHLYIDIFTFLNEYLSCSITELM